MLERGEPWRWHVLSECPDEDSCPIHGLNEAADGCSCEDDGLTVCWLCRRAAPHDEFAPVVTYQRLGNFWQRLRRTPITRYFCRDSATCRTTSSESR